MKDSILGGDEMSIASTIYAEYANKVKTEWAGKLQTAVSLENWEWVKAVLREMEAFEFGE